MLQIITIPALKDNYIYLLYDKNTGKTAAIDPSEASPVLEVLQQQGWALDYIFNTHHHGDHTGGNVELKKATGCKVLGYAGDIRRIPDIDTGVQDGKYLKLGSSIAKVMFIPGHTLGHIAYWFAEDKALFCGDTLFSLGCGRLFEGTPEQMYRSLQTLAALPDDTRVYCGHEYTVANGNFALSVEPGNPVLQAYHAEAKQLRAEGKATVPSTMAAERAANPFLRTESPEIRKNLGMATDDAVAVLAAMRQRKDVF